MTRLPPRFQPNPLHDPIVIVALLLCALMAIFSWTGCSQATLNRMDPPLPINANTYKSCPNVPAPGCRKDDQECPMEGTVCIDLPSTPCEGDGPCEVGGKRRASDAGLR